MKTIRWVCLIVGDCIGLMGCALFDFVYRPQWEHGALGLGLIAVGVQWICTGIAVWDQKDETP